MKIVTATFVNTVTTRTMKTFVEESNSGVLYTNYDVYGDITKQIGRPVACMDGDVFADDVNPLICKLRLM